MWENYKQIIIAKRKKEKYDKLVGAGAYVNTIDAKADDLYKNQKVTFDFVAVKYAEIPDSLISYSDKDVKAYFEAHKNEDKYKQKTSRTIEYITFDIKPTSSDSSDMKAALAAQVQSFIDAKNDSLFVITQSDNGTFNKSKYRPGDREGDIDSMFTSASIGDVVGPYFDQGSYKISKISSRELVPEINARHILLQGSDDEMDYLREKADSLKKVIKKSNNFAELAKEFSKDPGSGSKGGDLGWFGKGKMVLHSKKLALTEKLEIFQSYNLNLVFTSSRSWIAVSWMN